MQNISCFSLTVCLRECILYYFDVPNDLLEFLSMCLYCAYGGHDGLNKFHVVILAPMHVNAKS
jgi:hypothetical protein